MTHTDDECDVPSNWPKWFIYITERPDDETGDMVPQLFCRGMTNLEAIEVLTMGVAVFTDNIRNGRECETGDTVKKWEDMDMFR